MNYIVLGIQSECDDMFSISLLIRLNIVSSEEDLAIFSSYLVKLCVNVNMSIVLVTSVNFGRHF